ncbi:MAG: hypothetical protein U0973_13665 [Xanthomonadaceae bacterium]|nr:hypothetical protein [Xanthomonadaceae bacterium]
MKKLGLLSAGGDRIVNVIVADSAGAWPGSIDLAGIEPCPGPGWGWDGSVATPPPPSAFPISPRMTQLFFLRRATAEERNAIRAARATDAVLDDAMYLFEQARDVDVSLPLTQQLVGYLAQAGYIEPGRVSALLAPAPISEDGVLPQS